jgi:hypothetical protein
MAVIVYFVAVDGPMKIEGFWQVIVVEVTRRTRLMI